MTAAFTGQVSCGRRDPEGRDDVAAAGRTVHRAVVCRGLWSSTVPMSSNIGPDDCTYKATVTSMSGAAPS
jgi:hypothetical protein